MLANVACLQTVVEVSRLLTRLHMMNYNAMIHYITTDYT